MNKNHLYMAQSVALIILLSLVPDIVTSFNGERGVNTETFTPSWLKATRDLWILVVTLYCARICSPIISAFRLMILIIVCSYFIFGIHRGYDLLVCVKGVLWLPVFFWAATCSSEGLKDLYYITSLIFRILIPSAVFTSLALGFFGEDMYYEPIGPYARNPGMFLTPSATAFFALIFLIFESKNKSIVFASYFLGLLSVSGIFFINAALAFGRMKLAVYIIMFFTVVLTVSLIEFSTLLQVISSFGSSVRSGDAILVTLGSRYDVILGSISQVSFFGNFPEGLLVAVNQGSGTFIPDNAVLSLVYAFGIIGFLFFIAIIWALIHSRNTRGMVLLLISSMFYVWFESFYFSLLAGIICNINFKQLIKTNLQNT